MQHIKGTVGIALAIKPNIMLETLSHPLNADSALKRNLNILTKTRF